MNRIEHYHDWLRDAHAMEKQAEKMLESMASRIENYPELRSRIEQHISETKNQLSQLESILDRNNISRSVIKDSMSKMAAFGQSIGGIFPSDEIVKGSISGYVFEQFEIACYTSLLAAAKMRVIQLQYPLLKQFLMKKNKWLNGFLTIFLTPLSNSWSDLKLMELKPKNNSFEEALCLDT